MTRMIRTYQWNWQPQMWSSVQWVSTQVHLFSYQQIHGKKLSEK